jgi:hypothetical protein
MRKIFVGLAGALTVLALTVQASAADAEFGAQGQITLSADRLFGYYSWKADWNGTPPGGQKVEGTESGTSLGLLWGNSTTSNDNLRSVYNAVPRLSFDYFVIDRLSIGGSLGYVSISGSHEQGPSGGTKTKTDSDDVTAWMFAPRVGYAIMFNDS